MMNCEWGYSWYGRYFYHSWYFWLLAAILFVVVLAVLYFIRKGRSKHCSCCNAVVEEAYLRCPECGEGLKSHCCHCNRIVESGWQFCPHCKKSLLGS